MYYISIVCVHSLQLRANLRPFIANPVTFNGDAIGVQLKSCKNMHVAVLCYIKLYIFIIPSVVLSVRYEELSSH